MTTLCFKYEVFSPVQKLLWKTTKVLGDVRRLHRIVKGVSDERQDVVKFFGQFLLCPIALPFV